MREIVAWMRSGEREHDKLIHKQKPVLVSQSKEEGTTKSDAMFRQPASKAAAAFVKHSNQLTLT